VVPQIGSLVALGEVPGRFAAPADARLTYRWSDGEPVAQGNTTAGVYLGGLDNGFEITVPAGTDIRTLDLNVGGYKSRGRIEAVLSDDSSAPFSAEFEDLSRPFDRRVSITYRSATDDQTLTLRYTQQTATGNVSIQAAALQGSGGDGAPGAGPRLAPIGDRTVRANVGLFFTVAATQDAGPAALVLEHSPLPGGARFIDRGDGTGLFGWTPPHQAVDGSPYAITFTVTDAGGAGRSDSETIQIVVSPPADTGGQLIGSVSTPNPGAAVDLTVLGTADWTHWGLESAGSVNRKAAVPTQIGELASLADAPASYTGAVDTRVSYAWSDGSPTAVATTTAGLFQEGVGSGFSLLVPASEQVRTLDVYLGGYRTSGLIEAFLSDGSSQAFVAQVDEQSDSFDRRVSVSYHAASPNQTLSFRYTLISDSGNVSVQAAVLQGDTDPTPDPPPPDPPPDPPPPDPPPPDPPPEPGTGTALLSWQPPTQREDGAPLEDLAGYRVYYGTDSAGLDQLIVLNNGGLTSFLVENLAEGQWFFIITAVDSGGRESVPSDMASKVIG
jgi:hypothetical protein